jgi:hypothetical protein
MTLTGKESEFRSNIKEYKKATENERGRERKKEREKLREICQ